MIRFWLYYLATILTPLVPERMGYWLAERAGDLIYLLGHQARDRYLNNLTHVLGNGASADRRNQITRRAFRNLLKNYYDLFRMHRLTDVQLRSQLADVQGLEYLEEAMRQGRGILLGSFHSGNFNLIMLLTGLYLKDHRPVMVPVQRLSPDGLFELVRKQRASQGVLIVPSEDSARPIVRHLAGGNLVGLAFDLDVTHTGPFVDFFGCPAQLPDGAITLALRYDIPLILGYSRRLDDNRCAVRVCPPLVLARTGDRHHDTLAGMKQVVRQMEEWIRQCPEQWIMFEEVWKTDRPSSPVEA
ncbi:MAG: lysophospholipid acyltransferase family protein [Rudaea sp.]